ncbi:TauD/TfdA family dioxygenase [Streptomyces sp. bgisy100]|uniref:TauD/TfdA family dioxygenase n=1 Tax=Streptomyces sp. bgisy100 TaxID=3413783 RepID=UPI003D707DA5
MHDAAAGSVTFFTDHYVNARAAQASDMIAVQLRETGLVTVDGLRSRHHVLAFASRLMDLTSHPHSAQDGLTLIRDTGSHAYRAGFAGLGNGELQAHTERSGTPQPPRLMLLVCLRPALTGGDVLIADGAHVYGRLLDSCPEAAMKLAQPRTACYGAGVGYATQVITAHTEGRISIRLRQDSLARWSPVVRPYLPHLRGAIADSQHRIVLQAGQGYLLDNHRWLHARMPFSGDRRLLRALGEPCFSMPNGFSPLSSAVLGRPANHDGEEATVKGAERVEVGTTMFDARHPHRPGHGRPEAEMKLRPIHGDRARMCRGQGH